jgi:hypothetical protein
LYFFPIIIWKLFPYPGPKLSKDKYRTQAKKVYAIWQKKDEIASKYSTFYSRNNKDQLLGLGQADWDELLRSIRQNECTPFIGGGAGDGSNFVALQGNGKPDLTEI